MTLVRQRRVREIMERTPPRRCKKATVPSPKSYLSISYGSANIALTPAGFPGRVPPLSAPRGFFLRRGKWGARMITPSGREALLVEHPYLRWDDTMYKVETEQEVDGRWIAEVPELPGVLAYGQSRDEAVRKAQALSLHVLAELLDNGEPLPQVQNVFSIVA